MLLPPCSKKLYKWGRKCVQNCIKSIKYCSGRKDEKTTKKNTKNNTNCIKKHPPRVSHERGFRILKCIRVGFRARWAPRPLHTAPRHLQTTIFCSFACHLVWFVVDSWCILSKKSSQCDCSLVCVRECIFSIKHGNIGNETNKWVGTRPTFLARWRGCRRQLDKIPISLC